MALGLLFMAVEILGSWLAFAGVILVGMITFLALGAAIGSVSPSMRAANIIIWVIFLPMLMLSELFLPISVLDGGHMVFLAYEGVRGKPPSEGIFVGLSYLGLALILILMVWVLGLDFGLIARQ